MKTETITSGGLLDCDAVRW